MTAAARLIFASLACFALGTGAAHAQATLDGMPRVAQWTDFENQAGELPVNIWGSCAQQNVDRVGIRVDFNNGVSAFASYSGASGNWNVNTFTPGLDPDTSGGFLASCTGVHFLYDNKNTDLPMAWESCSNAFSGNFDLDAGESSGSNWRADSGGWVSVNFQTYCGTQGVSVPVPAQSFWSQGAAALALALTGAFVLMRRRAR